MPDLPSWSFLIEHSSGQKLLYDLGVPKAWNLFSPCILQIIEGASSDLSVEDDVVDILKKNGIEADQISGVIWRWAASLSHPLVSTHRHRLISIQPLAFRPCR